MGVIDVRGCECVCVGGVFMSMQTIVWCCKHEWVIVWCEWCLFGVSVLCLRACERVCERVCECAGSASVFAGVFASVFVSVFASVFASVFVSVFVSV